MNADDLAIGGYYRHKKTGGTYQLQMFATIEATMTPARMYLVDTDVVSEAHKLGKANPGLGVTVVNPFS